MRHSLAIVTFILLLSLNSWADSEFDIAVKGGADAATLDHDNREVRHGFTGGLAGYLQRPLRHGIFLGVQLDLLYTPRGAEAVFNGVNQGESRSHYMDLMVAVRPGMRLGPVDVYVLLGGGPSFLVSANKTVSGSNQDITGDLHRVDVATLAGAGLSLHLPQQDLGPLHLSAVFVEAHHDIGLLDTDAVNGGFKNRSSSFLLGLSFVVAGPATAGSSSTDKTTDQFSGRSTLQHRFGDSLSTRLLLIARVALARAALQYERNARPVVAAAAM